MNNTEDLTPITDYLRRRTIELDLLCEECNSGTGEQMLCDGTRFRLVPETGEVKVYNCSKKLHNVDKEEKDILYLDSWAPPFHMLPTSSQCTDTDWYIEGLTSFKYHPYEVGQLKFNLKLNYVACKYLSIKSRYITIHSFFKKLSKNPEDIKFNVVDYPELLIVEDINKFIGESESKIEFIKALQTRIDRKYKTITTFSNYNEFINAIKLN
jgi:hypothetical protein